MFRYAHSCIDYQWLYTSHQAPSTSVSYLCGWLANYCNLSIHSSIDVIHVITKMSANSNNSTSGSAVTQSSEKDDVLNPAPNSSAGITTSTRLSAASRTGSLEHITNNANIRKSRSRSPKRKSPGPGSNHNSPRNSPRNRNASGSPPAVDPDGLD